MKNKKKSHLYKETIIIIIIPHRLLHSFQACSQMSQNAVLITTFILCSNLQGIHFYFTFLLCLKADVIFDIFDLFHHVTNLLSLFSEDILDNLLLLGIK